MKVKIDNILSYKDPSGLTKKDLLKMKADLITSARKLLEIMPKNALYDYIDYDGYEYTYMHKNTIDMIKEDKDNLPKNNAIAAMEKRINIFCIFECFLLTIVAISGCAMFASIFIDMLGKQEISYFPITGLTCILLTTIGLVSPKIILFFNDMNSPLKNQLFEDICVELENIKKTLELFEELSYLKRKAKEAKKKGKKKLEFTFGSDKKGVYFLRVDNDHLGELLHELKYVNPKIFKKNKK